MSNKHSWIHDIFVITDFLDQTRWSTHRNYNQINYCCNDLSDDQKLLTHWFCYISDRQMPFERVWSIGGFIYSEIVRSFTVDGDFAVIDPTEPLKSFFVRKRDFPNSGDYTIGKKGDKTHLFRSRILVADNQRLKDYGFSPNTYAYFIPRYYPTDYKSILFTLTILRDFDFSLVEYLIPIAERFLDDDDLVRRLLFSLYLLTYSNIGQPKGDQISFAKFSKQAEEHRESTLETLNNLPLFETHFKEFKRGQIFRQKRAWCSLRDFFKSPEFQECFFKALEHHGFRHAKALKKPSLLSQFELPGDIWNNNAKFRQCILREVRSTRRKKQAMPETIREIFDKDRISVGYPEQFDITFDLVPRTCDTGNCRICPYGLLNGKAVEFKQVCIRDNSKYCPVALATCGYRRNCTYPTCALYNIHRQYFG